MANANPKGNRFTKGNKVATSLKGKPKKKTLIKRALGLDNPEKAAQLRERIDELTTEFLYHREISVRQTAWKEILKYTYPQKKTVDLTTDGESLKNNVFVIPAFSEDNESDPTTKQ